MTPFHFKSVAAAAALAALGAAPPARADVANGGFESGSFAGWTISGAVGFTGVTEFAARSGGFGAYFGEDAPGSSVSQSFATVAGTVYVVCFWLQLDDSAQPNSFSWSWNGATQLSLSNVAGFSYAQRSTQISATGASSTLQFNFVNPQSFWLLDDVSVSPVPEPGGLGLACAGLLLLAARRRLG